MRGVITFKRVAVTLVLAISVFICWRAYERSTFCDRPAPAGEIFRNCPQGSIANPYAP